MITLTTTKKTLVIVTTKYTYIAWFQQRTFTLVTTKEITVDTTKTITVVTKKND